ncbi:MAG: SOS response-associated peptidase family protein [Janthinobacterium lividum]
MTSRFELRADSERLSKWIKSLGCSLSTCSAPAQRGDDNHPVLRPSRAGKTHDMTWMREGPVAPYALDEASARRDFNTLPETEPGRSLGHALHCRRCIIPADVLHQCRHLSHSIEQPCSFAMESGAIFGIAGIWQTWTNEQGNQVEAFAILEMPVTPVLRSLFDRMPVVLTDVREQKRWLRSDAEADIPFDLLRPLNVAMLRNWRMMPGPVAVHLRQAEVSLNHYL